MKYFYIFLFSLIFNYTLAQRPNYVTVTRATINLMPCKNWDSTDSLPDVYLEIKSKDTLIYRSDINNNCNIFKYNYSTFEIKQDLHLPVNNTYVFLFYDNDPDHSSELIASFAFSPKILINPNNNEVPDREYWGKKPNIVVFLKWTE